MAVAATVTILQFLGNRQVSHAQAPASSSQARQPSLASADPELLKAEGLSRTFRAAAQKVLPAAVVIKVGMSPVCPRCGRPHESDEQGDATFGDDEPQRAMDILGSGFIIAPTGTVHQHVFCEGSRAICTPMPSRATMRSFSVRTRSFGKWLVGRMRGGSSSMP